MLANTRKNSFLSVLRKGLKYFISSYGVHAFGYLSNYPIRKLDYLKKMNWSWKAPPLTVFPSSWHSRADFACAGRRGRECFRSRSITDRDHSFWAMDLISISSCILNISTNISSTLSVKATECKSVVNSRKPWSKAWPVLAKGFNHTAKVKKQKQTKNKPHVPQPCLCPPALQGPSCALPRLRAGYGKHQRTQHQLSKHQIFYFY